jgi:hypothetical protein
MPKVAYCFTQTQGREICCAASWNSWPEEFQRSLNPRWGPIKLCDVSRDQARSESSTSSLGSTG